jgi:hypothetical protein
MTRFLKGWMQPQEKINELEEKERNHWFPQTYNTSQKSQTPGLLVPPLAQVCRQFVLSRHAQECKVRLYRNPIK